MSYIEMREEHEGGDFFKTLVVGTDVETAKILELYNFKVEWPKEGEPAARPVIRLPYNEEGQQEFYRLLELLGRSPDDFKPIPGLRG